jgi:hypothetical protein
MTPQQQSLLRRILLSRYFSNTVILGKMLQYLSEETANSDRSLKEYEIALEVLRRPQSFDPKLDPVVRVSMKGIRQRLQDYFEAEGKNEEFCLTIPKGHYRVQFAPLESRMEARAATTPSIKETALRQFWGPYLRSKSNVLLHTEPLFFRDGKGTFVRSLYVNDPATGARELAGHLGTDPGSLQPCFHYLSAGEVHCMFSLLRLFHDLGNSLQIANSRISSWNETRHSNLILLGCTRTNRFMDDLQEESDFVITDDDIRDLSSIENGPVIYQGHRYKDGKLPRLTEYALVTRRRGATPQSAVTIIASNHGRAVEGAGYFLTLENEVSKLLKQMGFAESEALPDRFQILLRVEMIDLDDEVVNVEYLDHRVGAAVRRSVEAVNSRG